jgi:hypothetical protein
LCGSCGSRVFSLAAEAVSGWFGGGALVSRFMDGRNPIKRFTWLISTGDDYAMGVILLLGGITMDLLPFITVYK